jgi:hypothetical protein
MEEEQVWLVWWVSVRYIEQKKVGLRQPCGVLYVTGETIPPVHIVFLVVLMQCTPC